MQVLIFLKTRQINTHILYLLQCIHDIHNTYGTDQYKVVHSLKMWAMCLFYNAVDFHAVDSGAAARFQSGVYGRGPGRHPEPGFVHEPKLPPHLQGDRLLRYMGKVSSLKITKKIFPPYTVVLTELFDVYYSCDFVVGRFRVI